jgi:beta-N-acetylhexosaminidase
VIPVEIQVGQLFVVVLEAEGSLTDAIRIHRDHQFGGVFLSRGNLKTVEQVRRLTFRFRRHSPDVPPPLVCIDEEGGLVSTMGHITSTAPSAAALGAIDDVDVTRDVYQGIAEKLQALGVNTVFAPVLDVNSEPKNPVIGTRSFGTNPELVMRHGLAAMEGLHTGGMLVCVKHFPGHGDTRLDSHKALPVVTAKRDVLEERDFVPFREAFDAEPPPDMVMSAHVAYPAIDKSGTPATLSDAVLRDLLRRDLGYQGLVITDAMEMAGVAEKVGPEKAAVEAILAGADLLLYGLDPAMARAAHQAVVKAVESGRISEGRLAYSVDRVARVRESLRGRPWLTDEEAEVILEVDHEPAFFQSALSSLVLEGNAGILGGIGSTGERRLVIVPRALDPYRPLPLGMLREQLEPAGFRVLDVGAIPTAQEMAEAEAMSAEADVVVVATASRGPMAEENQRMVAAVTRRDIPKVGVALLDPGDADHMMTTNCRIKTFGFATPQLWALAQKLLG